MIKIFLVSIAFVYSSIGATINAVSAGSTDVQNAINTAVSGDTVLLPSSGSATWAATVTIGNTKGITLNGNNSTITRGATSSILLDITTHATVTTRVTSLIFNQTTTDRIIELDGGFTHALFRVDHCSFNTTDSGAILGGVDKAYGLFDHCTWQADDASEMMHVEAYGASDSTGWGDDVNPGSSDAVYFENCTFTKINQGAFFFGTSAVQSYYGARTVVRFCYLDYCQIDQHGTGGNIGARWWEIYGNTNHIPIAGGNQSDLMQLRGGSGVVCSNIVNGGANGGSGNIVLYEEDSGYPVAYQVGRGKSSNGSPPYNTNQALDPAYCWQNTKTASSGSANVQLDRDFYLSEKPGYTIYTYPHPLISGGLTSYSSAASGNFVIRGSGTLK